MANDIWFISDTHFFHKNMLKFVDDEGKPIRPWTDVDDMNWDMVERWNKVVKPGDKIYHLGDVTFDYSERFTNLWSHLHGRKRLLVGNHDNVEQKRLWQGFEKIGMWRIFKEYNFMCAHLPIGQEQFRKVDYIVHGHIHQRPSPTKNHICVSVEQTDYTPVHLDEIISRTT